MARNDYRAPAPFGRHIAISPGTIQSYGSTSAATFRDGFETGSLAKWTVPANVQASGVTDRPATPVVRPSPVAEGSAARLTLLAGDTQTRLVPVAPSVALGARSAIGLSVFVDAAFPLDLESTRHYLLDVNCSSFVCGLAIEGALWKLLVYSTTDKVVLGRVRPGAVTRLALDHTITADPTTSLLAAYLDGVKMVDRTGLSHPTLTAPVTYAVGLRRTGTAVPTSQGRSGTCVAYVDDVAIGPNYAAVA